MRYVYILQSTLKATIKKLNIGSNVQVHHLRDLPNQIIPKFIEDRRMDVLVMSSVAHTDIHSFIIDNSAENILQNLGCFLLALKPNGFVSPM